jgi:alpha-beta hydrolase superfamily lysophospholipase
VPPETRARLLDVRVPRDPVGQVVVMHGGASRGHGVPVSPTQLSVVRMVPIARRVARAGRGRLAVVRLLNSVRGWDGDHTPVDDARWALDQLAERFGTALPTCLVGHSLGGRAALLAATRPEVRSAVALAPWVYETDGRHDLAGRRVLVVHGTDDRIADPARSRAVARDLARTAQVGYVSVAGGSHSMLRHHGRFDRYAAQFAAATLLDETAAGPVGEVLAGQAWVDA